MSPVVIFLVLVLYFSLLMLIAWITSRGATSHTFFIANRRSKWYWVAIGMVGTSLSGVTFVSVPGWVGSTQFSYMAMVLGYIVGYVIIALVLLPLYYRLRLPSIYSFLNDRFGKYSYKTGAAFFILSRTLGAAFRVFIVVKVLQIFVFDAWHIPFAVTTLFFLVLMLLYTYKGGVKTLVYTDTLQTIGMVGAVILTIYFVSQTLNASIADLIKEVSHSNYSQWFYWGDWSDKRHFLKQFFAGMFITLTMTGLDQEMMQKNLSCRSVSDAQKNMITYSLIIAVVNLLFLFLGALLYLYSQQQGIVIPSKSDDLFPTIALQYMGGITAIIFLIGIISAAFPSADGALTSLTTIFSIDILGLTRKDIDEKTLNKKRIRIHVGFALLMYVIVVLFSTINDEAIISELFTVAGYTYGPLLGLYAYGLLTKRKVWDAATPWIAVASPLLCYVLNKNSASWFAGYQFGFELIVLNGFITFVLLYASSFVNKSISRL
ncbi:MAG: sodium:solute symporter [Bacteroidales bacterium]|nr:sodium:solute symporter [Bacteroidales bacterium]